MHLYKRGKIWWVEYEVDKVRYRKSTGTKTRSEAVRWMSAISASSKAPTFDDAVEILKILYRVESSSKLMLTDAWRVYEKLLMSIGKVASHSTMRDRKSDLENFVNWTKKNAATIKAIEDVSGIIAAKYAEYLILDGKKSKTRINIISNLNNVWKTLSKATEIASSPWDGLRPRNTDGKRLDAFKRSDLPILLKAAREVGRDWEPICIIALNTGLRYEDCALLQWSEVDLDGRVLRIKPKKTKRHGIKVSIPMVESVYESLKDRIHNSPYVFPLHAERYGRGYDTMLFRNVLEKAGLADRNLTFHSFRHTAASLMAEAGVSKETRMAILGHTTEAMADHYDHDEHLAEKRKALEAAAITRPSSR